MRYVRRAVLCCVSDVVIPGLVLYAQRTTSGIVLYERPGIVLYVRCSTWYHAAWATYDL